MAQLFRSWYYTALQMCPLPLSVVAGGAAVQAGGGGTC
jgi:hypothetical protein